MVQQTYAYRYDASTGEIGDRRILVDLSDEAVEPDGLTIDQQGNLWSAIWNGWRISCFNPAGKEIHRINLPVQRPTSVTFGGVHLTDLYITSASVGLSQTEIQKGFPAGDLFRCSTQITGMATHSFSESI